MTELEFCALRNDKVASDKGASTNRIAFDNIEIIVKIFKSLVKKLFLFIRNEL